MFALKQKYRVRIEFFLEKAITAHTDVPFCLEYLPEFPDSQNGRRDFPGIPELPCYIYEKVHT